MMHSRNDSTVELTLASNIDSASESTLKSASSANTTATASEAFNERHAKRIFQSGKRRGVCKFPEVVNANHTNKHSSTYHGFFWPHVQKCCVDLTGPPLYLIETPYCKKAAHPCNHYFKTYEFEVFGNEDNGHTFVKETRYYKCKKGTWRCKKEAEPCGSVLLMIDGFAPDDLSKFQLKKNSCKCNAGGLGGPGRYREVAGGGAGRSKEEERSRGAEEGEEGQEWEGEAGK